MNDPISLAAKRARKSGDCRDWTARDVLKATLKDIEDGSLDPDMIYIAMRVKIGEGLTIFPSKSAGVSHLEAIGLLYKHLDETSAEGVITDE